MAKAAKPKKKTGFSKPEPFPLNTVLKDATKKFWCLGKSIGSGGFGEIYSACKGEKNNPEDQLFAVKIEPSSNGPLFVEQNFFIRAGKSEAIDSWRKERRINFLGIPALRGFGQHVLKEQPYRFLVLDKFGQDFHSYFIENGKKLEVNEVCNAAIQMIDALEYIHSCNFTHGDIKGTNMLFSLRKGEEKFLYLVDYGLAELLSIKEVFKPDPRRAHNGTIEYVSCDMHQGVPTKRSDLEILGYNIFHWLTSSLPWLDVKDPNTVFNSKQNFISSIKSKDTADLHPVVKEYFSSIVSLGHRDEPNYTALKQLLQKHISKGSTKKSPLKRGKNNATAEKSKATKRTKVETNKIDDKENGGSSFECNRKPEGSVKVPSWRDAPAVINSVKGKTRAVPPEKSPKKNPSASGERRSARNKNLGEGFYSESATP